MNTIVNNSGSKAGLPGRGETTKVSQGTVEEGRVNAKNDGEGKIVFANENQSFFGRLWGTVPDLVPSILGRLVTILKFREVSKDYYHLVSSVVIGGNCSLLSSKATSRLFDYNKLEPEVEESIKENFDFAVSNTQVEVKLTVSQFLEAEALLPSVPKSRLKLVLRIESLRDLNDLNELLESGDERINKIIGLDLEKIDINNKTLSGINKLFLNKKLVSQLTSLSFGKLSNVVFDMPDAEKLKTLSFGGLYGGVRINASHAFSNLSVLSFGNMTCSSLELNLPEELSALKVLSFGNISTGSGTLKLPPLLPELVTFSCGDIWLNQGFNLPEDLPELVSLSLGKITVGLQGPVNLSSSLPKLEKLAIGDIEGWGTVNCSDEMPGLKEFSHGKVSQKVKLKLPKSLGKLEDIQDKSGVGRDIREG